MVLSGGHALRVAPDQGGVGGVARGCEAGGL